VSASVVLDLGCCPVGSAPQDAFRDAGAKAVVVAGPAETVGDPLSREGAVRDDGTVDVDSWAWRLADLLGLHREALLAGCPVPLAAEAQVWARVADERDADRWDAVVVPVTSAGAGPLLDAPSLLLRVLDARLDALAPLVGDDPAAATQVASLLGLRPALQRLVAVAAVAVGAGDRAAHAHHGCVRPGGLALGSIDPGSGALARPGTGARADGDAFVWWAELSGDSLPGLHREGGLLAVEADGCSRTLALPAALARCDTDSAVVVDGRLEVRLVPDPDAWR
jgi:hypothetical protein